MEITDLPQHRSQLRKVLSTQGMRSALIYLNQLTRHRFTALYRFDNDTLKKTYFYDSKNPALDECADIPIEASYCVYLRRNPGAAFSTSNSLEDDRIIDHPKRKEILSYCGVPLTDSTGVMFGSICHFDLQPMDVNPNMLKLMESLATFITEIRDSGAEL